MIVEDRDNYKLDLTWARGSLNGHACDYLQVTIFTLKTDVEWATKVCRFSPTAVDKLFEFIRDYKESGETATL